MKNVMFDENGEIVEVHTRSLERASADMVLEGAGPGTQAARSRFLIVSLPSVRCSNLSRTKFQQRTNPRALDLECTASGERTAGKITAAKLSLLASHRFS